MRYYFAPMEGITDSIFRRTHAKYFSGVDRYYMPFLSPTVHRQLTHKEDRELPFADTEAFSAVPQIITKVAEDFLWAAQVCADRGYDQVNLNAGCPSGTVVSKGKGSGMLRDAEALDAFLEKIFSQSPLPISVKTRLGLDDPADFYRILEVYNRYPIQELIIHPRTRKQFYDGDLHMDMFQYALESSKNPLCFNGELRTNTNISDFSKDFPKIDAVMIGRGLIADPGMLDPRGTTREALQAFTEELTECYIAAFGGARNAMFRMKENWSFLRHRFVGSEPLWKQLRKTTDLGEYKALCAGFFATLPLADPYAPQQW
ncbi:MAG: tRNA-dihydrouridine synthase family protein [Ruminococcaceae bacterium]|nr:tRNA-dihydrouridine synthase family protein [Oscillospiraceae bacterium]